MTIASPRNGTWFEPACKAVKTAAAGACIILVQVRGEVSVPKLLEDLLVAAEAEGMQSCLLLGPTDPVDSSLFEGRSIAWLTWEPAPSQTGRPTFAVINPSDSLALRLFVSEILQKKTGQLAILGDFIDSLFRSETRTESLFILMSQIATRIKNENATGIFVISEELHDKARLAIARRFADKIVKIRVPNEPQTRPSVERTAKEQLVDVKMAKMFMLP